MRIWAAVLLEGKLRLWMANSLFVPLTFLQPCMSRPNSLQVASPGGAVLAVNASGEEVVDTCFCASGRVHDCVGKLAGKEVCMVWVRLSRGGKDEVSCLVIRGHDGGDAWGVGIVAWATVGCWEFSPSEVRENMASLEAGEQLAPSGVGGQLAPSEVGEQ